MKSLDRFQVDVVNVSWRDLSYLSRLLAKNKQAEAPAALKRLVAANTLSASPDVVAPQPYIIKEVAARATPGSEAKTVRVAFVGLTETTPHPASGFKLADPFETAKRVVPEAKKSADVVIALAHLGVSEATRLAREVPGLDAIISGGAQSGDAFFSPPTMVGDTFVVFTPFETRMIGELRFYRDQQGKFSTRARFITLDEMVPDDTQALKMVAQAASAEENARAMSKSHLNEWLSKSAPASQENLPGTYPAGDSSGYVSAARCAQCHMQQYVQWSNTGHAHSADKLVTIPFEFEMKCLQCHATGQAEASAVVSRFQSVQCEQCHGPGAAHALKPAKGYGLIANGQSLCATCHTPKASPKFNFQAAWAKIKH